MTTDKAPADKLADANRRVYRDRQSVDYWARYSSELLTAEDAILRRIEGAIAGKRILDLGVGGGRTTQHLLAISTDYLGVDYSPEMVAVCKHRYPDVAFLCCDARALDGLGPGGFDLVFFSFNGIDNVGHGDRLQIFSEVRSVLAPGGYFLFSAHNLREYRDRPPKPWRLAGQTTIRRQSSVRDMARGLYHYAARNFNYLRIRRLQVFGTAYSILPDPGQLFRNPTYYVDPVEQLRQLEASGFVDVAIFDRSGNELPVSSELLDNVSPVHYLARKS